MMKVFAVIKIENYCLGFFYRLYLMGLFPALLQKIRTSSSSNDDDENNFWLCVGGMRILSLLLEFLI